MHVFHAVFDTALLKDIVKFAEYIFLPSILEENKRNEMQLFIFSRNGEDYISRNGSI